MPKRESSLKNLGKAVLCRKRIGMRKVIAKIKEWFSELDTSEAFFDELKKEEVWIEIGKKPQPQKVSDSAEIDKKDAGRVEILKKAISENREASIRELSRLTGIPRTTATRIVSQYKLKG